MTDLLHLVGITPFDRRKASVDEEKKSKARLLAGNGPSKKRNIFELRALPLASLRQWPSLSFSQERWPRCRPRGGAGDDADHSCSMPTNCALRTAARAA